LAERELQEAAVPGLRQSDPDSLSFKYQNEEYPNRYGKSELYYGREGPFSDKRQVADPNAYYEHVRSLGTEGDPFLGARDDVDAPFAKQSGDYYDDYVNYDETTDRPYQGNWSWQQGYTDDLKGMQESDPMLMQALINSKNAFNPQGIVNVDQVKNLIANAQRNDFKNFYGNQDQWQGFVDRGDPLPIEPKQSLRNIIGSKLQNAKTNVGKKVGKGMDFMSDIKDYISQGGMLGMATKGIGSLLSGLGGALGFEDRQLSGGEGSIIDEYGNVYNADDLNKMNALGGYYTDPARSARRRTSRIAKMLARKEAKKNYSKKNLKRLQDQEAAQEKARMAGQVAAAQNASDRQNIQNIQNYTGRSLSDHRMSQPASQRNYTGAGKSGMGRNNPYYADGGLASLFTRRG
jgi:hypothetical protein